LQALNNLRPSSPTGRTIGPGILSAMADKHYTTKAEANRANAEHSTGPKTEEGKRIASHNALKTGLTGRTVLLPTDDLAQYQAHLERIQKRYNPQTDEEQLLADSVAHAEWRLLRVPTLETGILAVGREEFADLYPNHPLEVRTAMIDAKVHLTYGKQLANLALQEGRLQRQHERETAKLQALIKARQAHRETMMQELAHFYEYRMAEKKTFNYPHLSSLGFEFTVQELKWVLARRLAAQRLPSWPNLGAKEIYLCHEFPIDMSID
jgi:hypothetical protein